MFVAEACEILQSANTKNIYPFIIFLMLYIKFVFFQVNIYFIIYIPKVFKLQFINIIYNHACVYWTDDIFCIYE